MGRECYVDRYCGAPDGLLYFGHSWRSIVVDMRSRQGVKVGLEAIHPGCKAGTIAIRLRLTDARAREGPMTPELAC